MSGNIGANPVFLHKSIQEYHAAEYVKSLSLDKKKIFMRAILNSIKVESKMSATARYLYEIDKENAFNLLCAPLCEEYKIDKYEEDKEAVLEEIYNKLTSQVKFSLHKKPEKIFIGDDEVKDKRMEIFGEYISSIGPFEDVMKPLSIFTRYYNGDRSTPYNDTLIREIIDNRYINDIFRENYTVHQNDDSAVDKHGNKTEPYYILASDVIDKLGRKEIILNKIREITENIYIDAFMNNKSLIERKDDALKEILGF
ncbi:TPA: hypothetical protein J4Z37_004804 [Escherichia coli]|nr:hypothetical protein [Escherichia coli]